MRSVAAVAVSMMFLNRTDVASKQQFTGDFDRLLRKCLAVRNKTTSLCKGCQLEPCPTKASNARGIWDSFLESEAAADAEQDLNSTRC